MNKVELLLPAKDLNCGKVAINHGADAVYIGPPAFGARQAAVNTLQDIESLVNYAHLYGAKVHVTVNTLIFEHELESVRELLYSLYNIGVDAVLIQDLGILKMDIPPMALHASTQCHNYSVERIKFLQNVGFKRVVLARETNLELISEIKNSTNIELEAFVHGALCVSFSGQCYISKLLTGRSGNRGECAQICRTRFDLLDAKGNILLKNKHLLSIQDMCRADFIEPMLDAGVTSFKVEGRLKNENYVKNVTSYYRRQIDDVLLQKPDCQRSSSGNTKFFFTPDLKKTFNRGFTKYFIDGEREKISSFDTPKAIGEKIGKLVNSRGRYIYEGDADISNGDGLCFISPKGELEGFSVNNVSDNVVKPQKELPDFKKVDLYRNIDKKFEKILSGKTAERKISIDISCNLSQNSCKLSVLDEDGCKAEIEDNVLLEPAQQPEKQRNAIEQALSKLGATPFVANKISVQGDYFVRIGFINDLKNKIVEMLVTERSTHFRPKDAPLNYVSEPLDLEIDYRGNVINSLHKSVYEDFASRVMEEGLDKSEDYSGKAVMTCKYCLRYELGWCSRENPSGCPPQPLYISNSRQRFRLQFDCRVCEMKVISE